MCILYAAGTLQFPHFGTINIVLLCDLCCRTEPVDVFAFWILYLATNSFFYQYDNKHNFLATGRITNFLRLFCLCLSVQQLERDARLHCSNTSWAVNCVRQAAPQLIHPQAQKRHPCVLCTHEIVCKLTLLYYNGSNKTVCIFHTKLAHKSTQQNTQCSSSECLNVASLRGHVFWLACRFSQNTVAAGNRAPLWSFYILTFFHSSALVNEVIFFLESVPISNTKSVLQQTPFVKM